MLKKKVVFRIIENGPRGTAEAIWHSGYVNGAINISPLWRLELSYRFSSRIIIAFIKVIWKFTSFVIRNYFPGVSFFFRWFEFWIGIYIDVDERVIYICPIPMFGVKIALKSGSS